MISAVVKCLMPLPSVKFLNSCPVNDVPFSDTIISGIPNVENYLLRFLIVVKAEDEFPMGSNSIRLLCASTTIRNIWPQNGPK